MKKEEVVLLKNKICMDGICGYCGKKYANEEDFEDNNLLGTIVIKRNEGNFDAILEEFCSEECLIKWILNARIIIDIKEKK